MASPGDFVQSAETSGNLDSETAGTIVGGATLIMYDVKPGTLSARYNVDAETDTITLTPVWQVSDDSSTWERLLQPNGAAEVVMATGTGSADDAVVRRVSAPDGVYGHRFARCGVLVGVTTGTTSDTYAFKYQYQRDRG